MDTTIVGKKDGLPVNRFGERVIDCKWACGRKTTMLGTKCCDACHSAYTAARDPTCFNAIQGAFEEAARNASSDQ
jgi:hypothetical protein